MVGVKDYLRNGTKKFGLPSRPAAAGRGNTIPTARWPGPPAAFWKNGYAATSLDDLAAATGMNRPSLYAAFGDKRDLYLKTLTRYQQQSRAIGPSPPTRDASGFFDALL